MGERASGSDSYARDTIAKLRLRLLDVTTRNPLISFKHSAKTKRYIRVIDELPDQLYARLESDSGMRFKSLDQTSNEPEDEKTILFRRALDAAKLEDGEYLQKLQELGEDPGEITIDRLEQELRVRLREQLCMPPRRSAADTTPADAARKLGLDPSFDMPASLAGADATGKHADSSIQTLLFDGAMESTLARMREVVRLSIEEAGVNPLFCVFGFLEWYENENSEVPLHAPLLLVPLNIERKLVRGHYQYTIKSTGEETQVNVAVAERLKRDFNIFLPPFDEGQTPESYFIQIQKIVERHKGWKVRRWITIGLFSFARIAMYHDLAPERWESQGGLEKHPRLSRLMAGGGSADTGGSDDFTDAHDLDASSDGELDIPLISDADSSQLAALRDVLAGRSMVIEGPPGTGKSQTITNIIAAALAQGKTVLFLAEKMAALNVVRERLVHAQLEDFCLELHSTKAGRKETALALGRRLARSNRRRVDPELDAALTRLQTLHDYLARCVSALAEPAGKLGIPIQQLLWRSHAVRAKTTDLPSEIDELAVPDADNLTEIDLGRILNAVEQFEKARTIVTQSYTSVNQHPWHGVARHDINPNQADDIVRRVRHLAAATADAEKTLRDASVLTKLTFEKLEQLNIIAPITELPTPQPATDNAVVARLAEPQTLAALEQFARELKEHEQLRHRAIKGFANPEAVDFCALDDLKCVADAVTVAGLANATASQLEELMKKRQHLAAAWRSASHLMTKVAARAGWQGPLTNPMESALLAAVELAGQVTPRQLAYRTIGALAPGASDALRKGIDDVVDLRRRRDELASLYALSAISDSKTLRQHAVALRAAPFLPFLSPAWWRAKAAFKGLAKGTEQRSRSSMAAALDDLASLSDSLTEYNARESLKNSVGPSFQGIDSDLRPLLEIAEWADRVRALLTPGEEIAFHLRKLLFEGTTEQVESLAASLNPNQLAALKKASLAKSPDASTIEEQAHTAETSATQAARAQEAALKLKLHPEMNLSGSAELLSQVSRMRDLREMLDSSKIAAATLGDKFKGHLTPPTHVCDSAQHVRSVDAVKLPADLRDWLLQSEALQRLSQLHPLAQKARRNAGEVDAALAELTRVASVDYQLWIGSSSPLQTRAQDLQDHAERCAADPEGFQALIDDARAAYEVDQIGLAPLLDLLQSKRIPLKGLVAAAQRVIFQTLARSAIARFPALANFNGDRHDGIRKEFRELDHKLKNLRQSAIANQLSQRPVDPGSDVGAKRQWTGRSLVINEVSKQRGHIPVRELLDRAGEAIQQLMPCFMMSPLSWICQETQAGHLKANSKSRSPQHFNSPDMRLWHRSAWWVISSTSRFVTQHAVASTQSASSATEPHTIRAEVPVIEIVCDRRCLNA